MSIGKHLKLRKQKVNDILFIVRSVTEKRSISEHTQFFSEEKRRKKKKNRGEFIQRGKIISNKDEKKIIGQQ